MSSLPKNYRADLKYPGYTVMIAQPTAKIAIARSAWCVARRLLRSSSTPPSSPRLAINRQVAQSG